MMKKLFIIAIIIGILLIGAYAQQYTFASAIASGFSKAKTLLIGDVDVSESIKNTIQNSALYPVDYDKAIQTAADERNKAKEIKLKATVMLGEIEGKKPGKSIDFSEDYGIFEKLFGKK